MLSRWYSSKESTCQCRKCKRFPGLGRSPGEVNGNPFRSSCLENPMDRGASWSTIHGVTKSQTWPSTAHTHTHTHTHTHVYKYMCLIAWLEVYKVEGGGNWEDWRTVRKMKHAEAWSWLHSGYTCLGVQFGHQSLKADGLMYLEAWSSAMNYMTVFCTYITSHLK